MLLPHEVLGVSPEADLTAIKRAFRTLAKEWHPARNRDPRADDHFRELVSAYRTLVHDRTAGMHSRAWRDPHVPRTPRPTAASATADFGDDVSWVERPPVDVAIAYPAKLARIVVLGTLGAVLLFWISALLSQL